jgi:hypothetical protein
VYLRQMGLQALRRACTEHRAVQMQTAARTDVDCGLSADHLRRQRIQLVHIQSAEVLFGQARLVGSHVRAEHCPLQQPPAAFGARSATFLWAKTGNSQVLS